MNSTQIKCFIAVAECLNLSNAAGALFLSKQAVSKYIINLENELGFRLLARESGGISLTEAGRRYYAAFSDLSMKFDVLSDKADAYYSFLSQRFCIGYSEWLDPFGLLENGISIFRESHGEVRFSARQFGNQDLLDSLLAGETDVALFSGGQCPQSNGIELLPIAAEDMRLYAPKSAMESDTSPGAAERCWGLSLLMAPAWEWGYVERSVLKNLELQNANVSSGARMLPNFQSIYAEMKFSRGAAISDHNFGFLKRLSNLSSYSLGTGSMLQCAWKSFSENPLIPEFIKHMRKIYHYAPENTL